MNQPLPPSYPPLPSRRENSRPAPRRRRWAFLGGIGEVLLVLVLALVISTLLRQFILQVYSIPSASMATTLQVGDRILVNRVPVLGKKVERGDVIVFQDQQGWMEDIPESDIPFIRSVGEFLGIVPSDGKQVIVKRVIGIGGDTVSCCSAEGNLRVNGQAIDEKAYLDQGIAPATEEFTVTVPEGKFWVMGDNRPASADSLYHLPEGTEFIDSSAVIGRVQWVIWPFSNWSSVPHREAFSDVPDPS